MWKFFVNSSTLPNHVTGKLHRDKVLEKGRQTTCRSHLGAELLPGRSLGFLGL